MVCFVLFAAVHRVPNPALQACAAQQLLRVAPVEDWLLYSRTPVNVCSAQQTSRCHVAAVGVLKLCVCVTCCWQEKLPASRAVPYRLCPLGVKCEGAVSMYNITICSGVVVRSLCAHIGRIPGCGKWSEWCGGRHKFWTCKWWFVRACHREPSQHRCYHASFYPSRIILEGVPDVSVPGVSTIQPGG
jgi:hypothetical protein